MVNPASVQSLIRRVVLFAMGAGVFTVLVMLGNWQMDRGRFKELRMEEYARHADRRGLDLSWALEAGAADFSKVWLRGHFVESAPMLYLDNRTRRGIHGFHVLALFQPQGQERAFLVNLGWVAQNPDRRVLPDVSLPRGEIELQTLLKRAPTEVFRLGPDEPPVSEKKWIIQAIEVEALSERLGRRLSPFVLLLRPGAGFGLVREWKPNYVITPAKHRAYAFQWYSLAVAWVVLLAWAVFRNRARPATPEQLEREKPDE